MRRVYSQSSLEHNSILDCEKTVECVRVCVCVCVLCAHGCENMYKNTIHVPLVLLYCKVVQNDY